MLSNFFPQCSQLVEEIFHVMITKYAKMHVLPKLVNIRTIFVSFDFWMSRGGVDTFSLVLNYFTQAWESMFFTIRIFEVNETTNLCMAQQLRSLLENFGLIHHALVFVKDKGVATWFPWL